MSSYFLFAGFIIAVAAGITLAFHLETGRIEKRHVHMATYLILLSTIALKVHQIEIQAMAVVFSTLTGAWLLVAFGIFVVKNGDNAMAWLSEEITILYGRRKLARIEKTLAPAGLYLDDAHHGLELPLVCDNLPLRGHHDH